MSAADPSLATLAIVAADGTWKVYPTSRKESLYPLVAERVDSTRWSDFTFVCHGRGEQDCMTAIYDLCKRRRGEAESMFWTEDWSDRRSKVWRGGLTPLTFYQRSLREACAICPQGTPEMHLALACAIETRWSSYWDSILPDRAGRRKKVDAAYERRDKNVNRL